MTKNAQGIRLTIIRGFASPASVDVWTPEATIGRAPEATLRFDPQRDTASARGLHARLDWRDGAWWIECLHESGLGSVESDRVTRRISIGERMRITTPATFEVGSGGPRFEVVSLVGAIPATEVQAVDDLPMSRVPTATVTGARVARKRTVVLGISILVLACIGIVVARQLNRSSGVTAARVERLEEARVESAKETRELLAALDDVQGEVGELAKLAQDKLRAELARTAKSVWLVGLVSPDGSFLSVGTAWTCASNRLATNAHVAQSLREGVKMSGVRISARRSVGGDGETLEIDSAVRIHPAYESWDRRLQGQFLAAAGGSIRGVRFATPGDVAVLDVTRGDAGEALPLAPRSTAPTALQVGAPVGYVGYPSERMEGLSTLFTVTGKVTALTNFFYESGTPDNLLIHYDAVTTGGASGSPLISETGEVVALVFGGSVVQFRDGDGQEVRAPIGFNLAQSVQLLHELLDGTAESSQRARDSAWEASLSRLTLSPDDLLSRLSGMLGVPAQRQQIVESRGFRLKGSGPQNAVVLTFKQEAGSAYVVLAASHDGSDVNLYAIDERREQLACDVDPDRHPMMHLKPSAVTRDVKIAIVAASELVSGWSEVSLRIIKIRE
jgi:hypothetical protein